MPSDFINLNFTNDGEGISDLILSVKEKDVIIGKSKPPKQAMKEILTQKGKFIVVPLQDDAYAFEIVNTFSKELWYMTKLNSHRFDLKLPTFQKIEIIGLVSEILKDEEKAKMVVDFYHPVRDDRGYRDYYNWETLFGSMSKATDSFQSLCTKYELKETDLLIKKT